MQRTTPITNYA